MLNSLAACEEAVKHGDQESFTFATDQVKRPRPVSVPHRGWIMNSRPLRESAGWVGTALLRQTNQKPYDIPGQEIEGSSTGSTWYCKGCHRLLRG
jgi:hypothetical protein